MYVQHRMREPAVAARIWRLLSAPNSHVYIAGAANHMPKAVRRALEAAAVSHGGLDPAQAAALLQKLESQRRLQCETW